MTLRHTGYLFLILTMTSCQGETEEAARERATARNQTAAEQIDRLVGQLVEEGKTAGIALGLQFGSGDPYVSMHGLADVEKGTAVDEATRFALASVTKTFTAAATALLIERGQLGLKDSLARFFPDFPKGDSVTIYHLLSHTSGIADWWIGGLPEGTPETWVVDAHHYLGRMNKIYLFEPGSQYIYSSSNYVLLGEIVERVSGQPFAEFLQTQLFGPLGMHHTDMADNAPAPRAKGYAVAADTADGHTFSEVSFSASSLWAAGGLESTVPDMLAWTQALFTGEIVGVSLLSEMTTMARVNDGRPVYEAPYLLPGMSAPSMPEYIQKNGYGLGFSCSEIFGKPAIWHSGGMPGFNAIWAYLPESKTTLVLLSNTDNGAMPVFEALMRILTEA